jgi:hypothetical protein
MTVKEFIKVLDGLTTRKEKNLPISIELNKKIPSNFNPDFICLTTVANGKGAKELILSFKDEGLTTNNK